MRLSSAQSWGLLEQRSVCAVYKMHLLTYLSNSKKRLKLDFRSLSVLKYWACLLDRQHDAELTISSFNGALALSDQRYQRVFFPRNTSTQDFSSNRFKIILHWWGIVCYCKSLFIPCKFTNWLVSL